MDLTDQNGGNPFKNRVTVDFQYFIQSAVQKKLPWNCLAIFLTDLAPTLEKSKDVIQILVEELEKWVSITENCQCFTQEQDKNEFQENETIVPQNHPENISKQITQIQDDQSSLASSEMSDSVDESIEDTNEVFNNPMIDLDQTNQDSGNTDKVINETEENEKIAEDVMTVMDTIGNRFDKLVQSQEETQDDDDVPKLVDQEISNEDKVKVLFNVRSNLEIPNTIQVENKEFKCSYCGKIFTRKSNLKRHELIHTPENQFKCNACDKQFHRSDELKYHKSAHELNEIHSFQCAICAKGFYVKNNLLRHERNHRAEKSHKCNNCSKSFIKRAELQRHEMIHTSEKPFECTTCSKCFSQESNLKRHVMLHTRNLPFLCQNCGNGFASQSDLIVHERIHTGMKPHHCKTCSKSFRTASKLKRHEIIHTDEKPFQCKTCKKCFNQQDTLKRHEKIHS